MDRYNVIAWVVFLFVSSWATDCAWAQEFKQGDLPPLNRVVFYSSGVAHMQHRGTVTDKTQLTIRFGSHDIDDVLKSLTFEDQGGGFVRAVEYKPAPNPEDVAANDFQPMTLAQLLQKYRGEKVDFLHRDTSKAGNGTIFGVENRPRGETLAEALVTIDDDGTMQSTWLDEISNVRFSNGEVRDEMKLAMLGVVKSRKANQKKLDLMFDGQGEREIGFGYVVDAPIWRMTYRLEVQPEQVQLQGWTHINNVTGVDWKGVNVELRTGQPQSFHAELFAPILAERESVGLNPFDLPDELTLVRQFYGFEPAARFADSGKFADGGYGMGGGMGGGMMGGMGGGYGGGYGGTGGVFGGSGKKDKSSKGIDSQTAFQKLAQLSRTGTIVRFQLDKPVDLPSGKSAGLPVFKSKLPSRLLSVVKHGDSGGDLPAVKSIEMTNATKFSLVPGPVSVSRDGDFVGDAQIDRLPINETTLLPYSVDRAVTVMRRDTGTQRSEAIRFVNNQILASYVFSRAIQFVVNNEDKDARLMRIEYQLPKEIYERTADEDDPFGNEMRQPSRSQRLVVEPTPKSRAGNELTYEFPAPGLEETKFTLKLRWTETSRYRLRDITNGQVQKWLALKSIDNATKAKLNEIAQLNHQVLTNNLKMAKLRKARTEHIQNQDRARQNISALDRNAQAAAIYVKQLGDLETAIRNVDAELKAAEQKAEELQRKRNSL